MTENQVEPFVHQAEFVNQEEVQNQIIVCVDGSDFIRPLNEIGISFDATSDEILNAIRPIIREEKNVDIRDDEYGWLYKVNKSVDSQNIHIIPNSTAGK